MILDRILKTGEDIGSRRMVGFSFRVHTAAAPWSDVSEAMETSAVWILPVGNLVFDHAVLLTFCRTSLFRSCCNQQITGPSFRLGSIFVFPFFFFGIVTF